MDVKMEENIKKQKNFRRHHDESDSEEEKCHIFDGMPMLHGVKKGIKKNTNLPSNYSKIKSSPIKNKSNSSSNQKTSMIIHTKEGTKIEIKLKYTKTQPPISYAEKGNIKEEKKGESKQIPKQKKINQKDYDQKVIENLESHISPDDNDSIPPIMNASNFKLDIPVVEESPPASPVISQYSFETSSSGFKKSVCSFLSDLEKDDSSYFNTFVFKEDDNVMKIDNLLLSNYDGNAMSSLNEINISDSEDMSDTTSSSDSSSSSSSESSDSESDSSTSSNDCFSTGFGRFDSTTVPPLNFPTLTNNINTMHPPRSTFSTTAATTKPSTIFTPAICVSPQAQFKTAINCFPIPFKIYSLRDLKSETVSFPINQPIESTTEEAPKKILDSSQSSTNTAKRPEKRENIDKKLSSKKSENNKRSERRKSPLQRKSPLSSSPRREKRHSSSSSSHLRRTEDHLTERYTGTSKRRRCRSPRKDIKQTKHGKFDDNTSRRELPHEKNTPSNTKNATDVKTNKISNNIENISNTKPYKSKDDHLPQYNFESHHYYEIFDDEYFTSMDMNESYSDYAMSSEYFINNSNLVEITQQKRDRQRIESNQITVQVGNVLEIVPKKDLNVMPLSENNRIKDLKELKIKRKAMRDKKRQEKLMRKHNYRKEIQQLLDAGINFDDTDEEIQVDVMQKDTDGRNMISSILKTNNSKIMQKKQVKYRDGLFPFETSDIDDENEKISKRKKMKFIRRKFTKNRQISLCIVKKNEKPIENISNIEPLHSGKPPHPPDEHPPKNLPQPILKKITPDLFASFSINPEPIYFYLQKYQHNGIYYQQSNTSKKVTNNN